ncbi:MAG: nuclear transport factor 2 family protein [Acidobacteriia bacterium]|nr:nuclear transport factor 2 family protein [Terriglobia bacterium]
MPEKIEQEVLEANKRFYDALESLDIDQMGSIWLHESWVKCVHPGWGPISGWENVRQSWEAIFQNTQAIRVRLTGQSIRMIGDFAWVSCIENIANRLDASLDAAEAFTTNLFLRRDNRWWIILHHSSLLPAIKPFSEITIQ